MNKQILLDKRPETHITSDTFRTTTTPIPTLDANETQTHVVIRNLYLSLDPAMRGWMNDRKSYIPPVALGTPMRGGTISEVYASENTAFPKGTLVSATGNWQEYAKVNIKEITPIANHPKIPLTKWMGVLGMTGLTAYFGLLKVGEPKQGETLVVSGAAGATGCVVGQIGKILGLRVVGIAGDAQKCQWLKDSLGFDEVINYKTTKNFDQDLKSACPKGIDIYFDNVGGSILNSVLAKINFKARVVICGAISQYNEAQTTGPSNYLSLLINRAKMQGFIVFDYIKEYKPATQQLAQWFLEGKLKGQEHIVEGLDNAPEAINYLFSGKNKGKLIVKISNPSKL